jgi:hypothetical protein
MKEVSKTPFSYADLHSTRAVLVDDCAQGHIVDNSGSTGPKSQLYLWIGPECHPSQIYLSLKYSKVRYVVNMHMLIPVCSFMPSTMRVRTTHQNQL